MELEHYLNKYFQYPSFRPGQKEVIHSILEGSHTMAMLPTGTGKSLCYQLSGYLLDGHVLIVSPLLSLMQDQVEQMKMNGEKSVVALNSFLVGPERKQVLKQISHYKFIFISPETLVHDSMVNILKKLKIALFVIDEAHCISQWGFDFRPDYIKLGDARQKLGNPLTLALTATATKQVIKDILQSLKLEECKQYLLSVDRPNIAISIKTCERQQKKWETLSEYVSTFSGPGIIYFSSKKMAEKTVEFLQNNGVSRVMAYHGGMDHESRILIQQQFLHNQLDIICATSAFGMGINKENIRYVIHFHMPQQMESYIQEIGRAGRDGKPSIAILLYTPGDEQIAYQLSESEIPSSSQIDWLMNEVNSPRKNFLQQMKIQEELKRLGGFTDTQWRILLDYMLGTDSLRVSTNRWKDFKYMMENRRILKQRKIATMTHFTRSTSCRRDQILSYFEEKIVAHKQERCCDICGINDSFYSKVTSQESKPKEYSWKQRLADILLKE